MAFDVGNRVRVIGTPDRDNNHNGGDVGFIVAETTRDNNYPIAVKVDDNVGMYAERELELVTKGEDNMSDSTGNVVEKLELLGLDEPERLLRRYNVVDETGQLTDEGQIVLIRHLFKANKTAIVAQLKQLEAECKAEKKAKK
jgi:hypothetical protein